MLAIDLDWQGFVAKHNISLHDAGRHFVYRRGSAQRPHVLLDELLPCWPNIVFRLLGWSSSGLMRLAHASFLFLCHYRGDGHRICIPPMTGIASHLAMSLEIIFVDGKHH